VNWDDLVTDYFFWQLIFILFLFATVNLLCKRIRSQFQFLMLSAPGFIGTLLNIIITAPALGKINGYWYYPQFMLTFVPQTSIFALIIIYQLFAMRESRIFSWSFKTRLWVGLLLLLNFSVWLLIFVYRGL
jgi:hypothetical protein